MFLLLRIRCRRPATRLAACAGGLFVFGCASFDSCPESETRVDGECVSEQSLVPEPQTKLFQIQCSWFPDIDENDFPLELDYELTVKPGAIVAGQPFAAEIGGRGGVLGITFNDGFAFLGGHKRVSWTDLIGTVRVRSGATGDPVVLKALEPPPTCSYDADGRTDPEGGPNYPACDPSLSDESGANPDCTGLGGAPDARNPCLFWVDIPTSDDCSPGGLCDQLGERTPGGPCDVAGFCVSDTTWFPFETQTASFTADESGAVLFGWDDVSFGTVREAGPNRGTWDLPPIQPDTPLGPNSFRGQFASVPLAVECVMGVTWWHPDAANAAQPLASPAPDSELIAFPIQTP